MALLVSSFFMWLSVGVSALNGRDSAYGALLMSAILTFIVGIFPFIFVRKTQVINLKEGFVIIVLSWFLSFVFGMLPYVMWGGEISVVDAWFESVSGYTTTGATILNDIEALPKSLLFWRSSTHFIGGLGVVVFLLLIIPSASPFRNKLTKMEVSNLTKEGYLMQSNKMVRVIASVYIGIFCLSTLSLLCAGLPLFDAVTHGFSLCATGGFSIKNASIAAYDSMVVNCICVVFMLAATINFAVVYMCVANVSIKPLLHNKIVQYYLLSLLIMAGLVIISLRFHGGYSWTKALSDGFFTTLSYVTTTGFAFADNSHWPFLACMVLVYGSLQCATAGSTSSGIKMDRMMVVFKSIGRQIKSTLNPNSAGRIRFGETYMPEQQVLPVILYIVLYFVIIIVSSVLVLICNVPGMEAVSGSIACLGNVGPGLGAISATGNYDAMPVLAKYVFTLDMFLGRIEIYPLLIAISLIFRRNK